MSAKEKVILIRPDIDEVYPFGKLPPYLPLGLGFLAGVLKDIGFDIDVVDCYLDEFSPDQAADIVCGSDPIFAGISVNIANTGKASILSRELVRRGVTVVLGGPQVTVFPEKTMRASNADIGVVGEGELTIAEIATFLLNGKKDLSGVKGIIYPDKGSFTMTAPREPMQDLDSLPFVPVELFPHKRYSQECSELERSPLGWMSTSRGCPWDCSFCSNIYVWGRHYRSMSAGRIFREMKHLKDRFGIRALDFREDNFTVDRNRILELCEIIVKEGLDIEWKCESRVDIVDPELLRKMKEAGCGAIYFGVESGSQRVLDFLNKGFKLEQAVKALADCRKSGIKTIASVMLGVPTQTLRENQETIDLVRKLSPDIVYFNPFIGIPGSRTYDHIKERGLTYKDAGDIVLANSEFLSWPDKLRLKQKAEIMYNISPRVLIRHVKRIGVVRLFNKARLTFKRYFTARKSMLLSNDGPHKNKINGPVVKKGISVLMSVHEGETAPNLSAALESVFFQTARPDEVVLVEDGPLSDVLIATVRDWETREPETLKIIKLDENVGLAEALNRGLKNCSKELIARMDSDDVSVKERFLKQRDFLSENTDIDVVGGYSEERSGDLTRTIAVRKVPCRHDDIARLIKWRNPMNHASVMFRREAVESVGGYPPQLRKMQDYGLWAKMISAGSRFANMPEILVVFRAGEGFAKRRGGLGYFKYDLAVLAYLKKAGFLGGFCFILNLTIRFLSRISPLWARDIIYGQIRRREK